MKKRRAIRPKVQGKVVKLTGCERGSLTGYDLDSLGLNSVTLFIRQIKVF